MIGRYQKLTPAPAAWPDPKLGRVTSSADVQAVGAATFKEHEAGAMDDATYDREVANLNRYRAYYAQQDREAAIAAQKKKTPGSGGARVRGLVPPGEQ